LAERLLRQRHPLFSGFVRRRFRLLSVLVPVLCGLLLPAQALSAATPKPKSVYRDGPSGRYLLDGAWYERHDPADQGLRQRLQGSKSLAGWRRTTVPSAANAGDFSEPSYVGTVYWYRKDFKAPRSGAGTEWLFRFESVNYRAKVWLNGHPLGVHVGAYLPFEMRAKGIRRGGVNHLVVRVDSRRQKFDIPPLSVKTNGQFEGGWWNYNGILREVYLRKVQRLDVGYAFVEPRLRCRTCAATVRIDARVDNVTSHGRRARLVGSFGGRPLRFKAHRVGGHGSHHFKARLRIGAPRLWEPGHPYLYPVHLGVVDQGGGVVQRYTIHAGIRSLKVNRLGRIELNGREVDLHGAAIHEDSLSRGGALSPAQMRQTFKNLSDLGATITRQHYPLSPYELQLADRYGIMVWSEIPVFRMKSTLFNIAEIRNKGLRMLRQEVTRDFNHPSVMVWSIGNENASRPKRGLQAYIRRAARTVRALDPTRLIGIATSGFPTVEKQDVYLDLDVIGVNDYFGWYNGPRGSIADRAALSGYLNRLHADYPNQAFVITEVGAEANRHGPVTEKGTYEFQSDFLAYHFSEIDSKPFINAAIIWALHDFRVKPGWAGGNPYPHPPVNEKGLVDDRGFRKPAFAVVQRIFLAAGAFR
jgi:beta-galactosidase/beta-glucuronidase